MNKPDKPKIEIDISCIPDGMDLDIFMKIYDLLGIILYDSHKGKRPNVLYGDKINILDIRKSEQI